MTERSDALVLFGATGDLAKKMLYPALQQLARRDSLPAAVIGVAGSDWSTDDLVDYARSAVEEHSDGLDPDAFERLASVLSYIPGDYRDAATYEALTKALAGRSRPLLYLAIPPSLFETVVEHLADIDLNQHGRVVIEKPFGRDLASAR